MPDIQDLDDFRTNPIYNHVRRTNKFTCSPDFSRSAQSRERGQQFNPINHFLRVGLNPLN